MILFRLGSKGDEIKRIQEKLKELEFYRGPIDGHFGGGTSAAVKGFQKHKGLDIDGIVGPKSWKKLFDEKIKESFLFKTTLDYKCLALTASFETGKGIPECFCGLSGDFDGQGISFGALQWNFGQDSLQRLLKDMINDYHEVIEAIFQEYYPVLVASLDSSKEELSSFTQSIQHPVKHFILEPWRGMFKALGRTQEFQNIQVRYAEHLYKAAKNLCKEYDLWSERAVALMFDIKVQNGSIRRLTKAQINSDYDNISQNQSNEEIEENKMIIIANRRAEASNPHWIEDVRSRKLCIAQGWGRVHGIEYDLEAQFGIGLDNAEI